MKLTYDELRTLGAKIGNDVPFFIEGGTAIGSHFGEKIHKLPPLSDLSGWNEKYKIIVVPNLRKSTKDMYGKINLTTCGKNKEKTAKLVEAIEKFNTDDVIKNMSNDFENFAETGFTEIKDALTKNGAEKVLLCGSGTAVFAISNNQFDLKALSQALPHQHILSLTQ